MGSGSKSAGMSTDGAFSHIDWDEQTGQGAIVVGSLDAGLTRIGLQRGEPCDCPCWGITYNGVLYGPALPSEVHAAVVALDDRDPDAPVTWGMHTRLRETEGPRERRAWSSFPLEG